MRGLLLLFTAGKQTVRNLLASMCALMDHEDQSSQVGEET